METLKRGDVVEVGPAYRMHPTSDKPGSGTHEPDGAEGRYTVLSGAEKNGIDYRLARGVYDKPPPPDEYDVFICRSRLTKLCSECREAVATVTASKSRRPGNQLCQRCWNIEIGPLLDEAG